MRLIASPLCPFVRKVRVLLLEAGLADRVTVANLTTTPLDTAPQAAAANPLGKIPAVVRADGATLHDSRVITRYLDDMAGDGFYPQARLWEVLMLEATAEGIMEAAVLITYEGRLRPEDMQYAPWVEAQWAQIARAHDPIEARRGASSAGFGRRRARALPADPAWRYPPGARPAQPQDPPMQRPSRRLLLSLLAAAALSACGARAPEVARAAPFEPPLHPNETVELRQLINRYADLYDLPRPLVHRLAVRESTHRPRARNGPYYGLLQILPQTARTMGHRGPPEQLLDAETNLTYALKYLRGAWLVAGGDPDAAIRWYARGYYYEAKRKGLLVETGLRPS